MKPPKNKNCEYYPTEKELDEDGPFCAQGSDVSGGPPCTEDDQRECQWAKYATRRL